MFRVANDYLLAKFLLSYLISNMSLFPINCLKEMSGDMLIVSVMGQVMVNGNYLLASYTTESCGSGEAAGHSLNTKAT